jgi:ribosomal protein S18 acetylase RimI-like enzyme
MSDDPFRGYGLRPVELSDRGVFDPFFRSLARPLSDYTFGQIYTWRNSLHLAWKIVAGHLCVFANGSGDLTLLVPPIGDGGSDAALAEAVELMDDYNAAHGVPDHTGIEYTSDELLNRLDRSKLVVTPMGTDYVYDTARMIDLAGGDLASKRQAKNRFARNYTHRVETYDPAVHLDDCLKLLSAWQVRQDGQHAADTKSQAIKRQKETTATELALRSATDLGLTGMVVFCSADNDPAAPQTGTQTLTQTRAQTLRGFTFGESLGDDQSSIVIEKTDLETRGLAQFIFSEFCRRDWSQKPLTNVGDDWGLPSLAWTKMSYRPVRLLQKYALTPARAVMTGFEPPAIAAIGTEPKPATIRPAVKNDLAATIGLEQACFRSDLSLKKRQLEYLQQRPTAVFLVAEQDGQVVGEGIALVRQHKRGVTGRIYSLAVEETHRGKHIGAKLLNGMVDQLSTRGVTKVYLEVEQTNAPAIALYERHGFKSIGKLPNYYGGNRDGVHMRRDLTPA